LNENDSYPIAFISSIERRRRRRREERIIMMMMMSLFVFLLDIWIQNAN